MPSARGRFIAGSGASWIRLIFRPRRPLWGTRLTFPWRLSGFAGSGLVSLGSGFAGARGLLGPASVLRAFGPPGSYGPAGLRSSWFLRSSVLLPFRS